jgi:hypothetical protein
MAISIADWPDPDLMNDVLALTHELDNLYSDDDDVAEAISDQSEALSALDDRARALMRSIATMETEVGLEETTSHVKDSDDDDDGPTDLDKDDD